MYQYLISHMCVNYNIDTNRLKSNRCNHNIDTFGGTSVINYN